jgi:hypothetical protein
MASTGSQYPDYLNPFGSDDDGDEAYNANSTTKPSVIDQTQYPDHLDPFSSDDNSVNKKQEPQSTNADDYDDSLNPFGDDENETPEQASSSDQNKISTEEISEPTNSDAGNPFAETVDNNETKSDDNVESKSIDKNESAHVRASPSPESMEPPKPLPRTKSLLKKEQAHKKRLLEQQMASDHQTNSLQSTTSSIASYSSTTDTSAHQSANSTGSFQRQKHKRLAPPVPVNFKRQVSGSLDAIEEELEGIGDKLAIIDKESNICQETLTSGNTVDEAMETTRSKFIELIKRRNSIVRRQKELMYKKRELKLDQLYSDIEYELRMIGNKQRK